MIVRTIELIIAKSTSIAAQPCPTETDQLNAALVNANKRSRTISSRGPDEATIMVVVFSLDINLQTKLIGPRRPSAMDQPSAPSPKAYQLSLIHISEPTRL